MDTTAERHTRARFRPLSVQPPFPDTIVFTKYLDVVALYNDLLCEYQRLDQRATARERHYKENKQRIKDWNEYIRRKGLSPLPPLIADTSPARSDAATPRARAVEDDYRPVHPSRLRETAQPLEEHIGDLVPSILQQSSSLEKRITSSQTTQGDSNNAETRYTEEDDDLPLVVSARSLKRKRNLGGRQTIERDALIPVTTPKRTLFIKQESRSSPIRDHVGCTTLLRTETSDLDALPGRTDALIHTHMKTQGQERNDLDLTTYGSSASFRKGDSAQASWVGTPESLGEEITSLGKDLNHTPPSRIKADPDLLPQSHLIEDETPQSGVASHRIRTPQPHADGPLQPVSSNASTLPRTSTLGRDVKTNHRVSRSHGNHAIHALSEDGDEPEDAKRLKTSEDCSTPNQPGLRRLQNLLQGSEDALAHSVPSPRSAPPIRRTREQSEQRVTRSVEQPSKRTGRTVRDKASPKERPIQSDDPGPIFPEDEPLRSRPLYRLSLDDFKINPEFNAKLGYAYSETIRNQDNRRRLPGVVRPEFIKLAEMGALPNAPRRSGLFDASQSHLTDDELTLQGYLGSGYAQVIQDASDEQKHRMLIDARAKAFADQHGRDRQAFERRKTPPGFWRTDMPTTQEQLEYREDAQRMERQKVEERWLDATKGGGRYVFRDE